MKRHSGNKFNLVYGPDNKSIGHIEGRTFFGNDVLRSKHYNHRLGGWSLPERTFREVIRPNCDHIEFIERESQKIYMISTVDFERFSVPFATDGCAQRLVVKEEHWTVLEQAQTELQF